MDLFVGGHGICAHAQMAAPLADVGEGVVIHHRIRRGRFIRHDADPAVGYFPFRVGGKPEYHPGDGEMRVGGVVQRHIRIELWMPQHETLSLPSLPDRKAVQRQEPAGIAWIFCPQAVFEAA